MVDLDPAGESGAGSSLGQEVPGLDVVIWDPRRISDLLFSSCRENTHSHIYQKYTTQSISGSQTHITLTQHALHS